MDLQPKSTDRPVAASLKATYRALLACGLEAGEAANLTGFLHGLPSAGLRWTLPEVEAIVTRRLAHAAERRVALQRAALISGATASLGPIRPRISASHVRPRSRFAGTRVITPPNA